METWLLDGNKRRINAIGIDLFQTKRKDCNSFIIPLDFNAKRVHYFPVSFSLSHLQVFIAYIFAKFSRPSNSGIFFFFFQSVETEILANI